MLYLQIFNIQNYILSKILAFNLLEFIIKIFLRFPKFQAWYSYKIYSY